ncbi:MAG TPA: glycosyltransferase [Geminicoccus sp.]|uniref:glycosyltransferase family 2 protein n=1 Tax=Geminicoccus sp. TaxID=2024832 RepID=UPI002E31A8D5|nr:glycosyltransferase [Geminicoccus sp.]HEX2528340.1 glycosyltransferase [Geminicoccus sp.]
MPSIWPFGRSTPAPAPADVQAAAPTDPSRLSVVLGTLDRLHLLKVAIESVRAQKVDAEVEIVVIDGGSSDGTLEWLVAQKDIITIVQHNRGDWQGRPLPRRSWGFFMNLAFRAASTPIICMISDDCLLLPGTLQAGLDRLGSLEAGGEKVGGLAFHFRNWPDDKRYFVGKTLGGRMMVNHGFLMRAAMEDVGWIDAESYRFYKADSDLCLKMWDKGWTIRDVPGAFVEHYVDPGEALRMQNNQAMAADRDVYVARWQALAKQELPSRQESDWQDPEGTADRVFGPIREQSLAKAGVTA